MDGRSFFFLQPVISWTWRRSLTHNTKETKPGHLQLKHGPIMGSNEQHEATSHQILRWQIIFLRNLKYSFHGSQTNSNLESHMNCNNSITHFKTTTDVLHSASGYLSPQAKRDSFRHMLLRNIHHSFHSRPRRISMTHVKNESTSITFIFLFFYFWTGHTDYTFALIYI